MKPSPSRAGSSKRPVWAIVPAKSLQRGKSRLRPVLDDRDRTHFARALLEHVLDVLAACELDGLLVATDGDDVAALAAARGAHVLRDRTRNAQALAGDLRPGPPPDDPRTSSPDAPRSPPPDAARTSLADVVDDALAAVAARGARAAVVLMADLPRVQPVDVGALLAALDDHDVAVVCDHLGQHTNALALAPPTAMPTHFGREDSFAAHCAAARGRGLRAAVVASERIAFDVDVPADHRRFTERPPAIET